MRPALLVTAILLTLPLSAGAAVRYEEPRELRADATGIQRMKIDAGAGFLDIRGDDQASAITVTATLWVEDHPRDEEKVRAAVDRNVEFRLETDGDTARLVALTSDPGLGYSLPHMDLRVTVPAHFALDIRDRSGWLNVEHIANNVEIRDGSGSIALDDIGGHVAIEDDSGPIAVTRLAGRLGIDDGSGSVEVEDVTGDVAVDDGSGSIAIREVRGNVTIRDGSGSILVAGVTQDLHVLESGSGSVSFIDVGGSITVDD
jgi:hypothetical protein